MSKKKESYSLKELSEQIKVLLEIQNNEPLLVTIILGSSFIELCLKACINQKLVKREFVKQWIYDLKFNNLIELSFSLGIISENMRADIKTIKSLRNDFAHKFSDSEIKEIVSKLNIKKHLKQLKTPFTVFDELNFGIHMLSSRIIMNGMAIEQEEKKLLNLDTEGKKRLVGELKEFKGFN